MYRRLWAVVASACLLATAACTTAGVNQSSMQSSTSSAATSDGATGVATTQAAPTSAAPSESASPTSASPSASCSPAVPPTLKVSKGTLPRGTSFGFVRFFDGTALYVDPAQFFGNEAAQKAARADGEIGPHEELPDPFYIRNRSSAVVRVPVSATLQVRVIDNQKVTENLITTAQFASLYCGTARPDWLYSDPENLPANLTMVKGEVTRIEEQYTP